MSPSEPTWPSWQCSLLMNVEPSPKGFRQVLSQIISGGEGDGGGGEGEGGGDGGQERNVTVPTHTLLASAMASAQASPESPCRLRPEGNSACVLRGGRLIVWPGLGTTRSLPPPGLRLKDQSFVLCVSTYTCTCTCMRIIRCLLDSQSSR